MKPPSPHDTSSDFEYSKRHDTLAETPAEASKETSAPDEASRESASRENGMRESASRIDEARIGDTHKNATRGSESSRLKYSVPPQYLDHSDADSEPYASNFEAAPLSEGERAEIEERIIAEAREVLSQQVIGEAPLVPLRAPWHQRVLASVTRHHAVLLLLCTLLLWGALSARLPDNDRDLRRGAVATRDIVAPRATSLLDRETTQTRREEAAALVTPEYDSDLNAQARALSRLETPVRLSREESAWLSGQKRAIDAALSTALRRAAIPSTPASKPRTSSTRSAAKSDAQPTAIALRNKANLAREALTARAANRLQSRLSRRGLAVSSVLATQLVTIETTRWVPLEKAARDAVRAAYLDGGRVQQIRSDIDDDLIAASARMKRSLARAPLQIEDGDAATSNDAASNNAASNNATSSTRITRAPRRVALSEMEKSVALRLSQVAARVPNLVVNEQRTSRARLEAQRDVAPVMRSIAPGTVLVATGTAIDDEKWTQLQDLDLVAARLDWSNELARLALCALVVVFGAAFVARFAPTFSASISSLWLLALVPVITLLLCRVALRVPFGETMIVPIVACAAMILTILLDVRAGALCALGVSMLLGALTQRAGGDSMTFGVVALGSLLAVLAVGDVTSRMHLVRAGAAIALTHATLHLILHRRDLDFGLLSGALSAAALAAAATIVAAGLAMFLERPLGITTHLSLLELSSPDEPVMRRMQGEAPGTYTHSLMVAQLAEAGAKAVGADPLLCRVGGLYHDIGKLRRPHCFIENQSGINVHDRLSPQLSALLIVAHVKDGLTLARVLRLPRPVQDIVAQHHGRSLVSYFYNRALEAAQNSDDESSTRSLSLVDEALFRYPGPRPQSKEAAVVMLADSIEASSRSLRELTPEKLDAHIKNIVESRLREGELDDCELTLRDLSTIEKAFAHVLRGALHQRIAYPDPARELATLRNSRRDDDWTRDTRNRDTRNRDTRNRDVRNRDTRNRDARSDITSRSSKDSRRSDELRTENRDDENASADDINRNEKAARAKNKTTRTTKTSASSNTSADAFANAPASSASETAHIEYSKYGENANAVEVNEDNAEEPRAGVLRSGVLRSGVLRETVRETMRARSLRNVRQATAAALTSHLKKNETEKTNGRASNKVNAETAEAMSNAPKTSPNGTVTTTKNGVATLGAVETSPAIASETPPEQTTEPGNHNLNL